MGSSFSSDAGPRRSVAGPAARETTRNNWTPVFSALLPHAPILVPDVGREHLARCQATHDACAQLAGRLVASQPDRLVLVSPHAPRTVQGFGLWSGRRLYGNLADFGAAGAAVDLPNDEDLARAVESQVAERGCATWRIPAESLDHGSVVPLWFLAQAGWNGPTLIASLPGFPRTAELRIFGEALTAACRGAPGRTALVASGDMTHRAQPGAPAGYHPDAVEFDRALVELVESGHLERIQELDPSLREIAAEDAADSAMVVAAAGSFGNLGHQVLSYEHPFGVGYMVAVLQNGA